MHWETGYQALSFSASNEDHLWKGTKEWSFLNQLFLPTLDDPGSKQRLKVAFVS